jgi:biopolymer transport protein ExbD
MPIKPPGPHLGHDISLEMARKRMTGQHKKSLYASLNLVAYIDMMTTIVIFLLMTFSATGEILFVSKSIVLPNAQNWKELERAPVIGVTTDVVTLDGKPVADSGELQKADTVDWKITDLHDQLVTMKNNYKLIHPNEDFKGICIVQSDKKVPFKVVKKVMFSAAIAGYQNVNFAVRPDSKAGAGEAAPAAAAAPAP